MLYFTWKFTEEKRGVTGLSFAVVRMIKLKSHDLKGVQFHNQRERESKTNPDIDESKSALNYDLLYSKKIDYNKQVKQIIESQKEGTRKIRKDAVLVNELMITSDKTFFENLTEDREKEFFKASVEFFQKRYGEQNIAYAAVHKDERTPHLHLGVVPMRDGKLQGKNVFNRKELLAIQNEYPKHMQSLGFDLQRGELGSKAEHIEKSRFEVAQAQENLKSLKEQQKALEGTVEDLGFQKEMLDMDIQELVEAVDVSVKVESIPVEKAGLFDRRSIRMTSDDFERIKTLAKASEGLKTNEKALKTQIKGLSDQNIALKNANEQLKKEKQRLVMATVNLEKENKQLAKERDAYKSFCNYYKRVLEEVKRLSEHYIKVDLNKMQRFLGQVRMLTVGKIFGEKSVDEKLIEEFVPVDERKGASEYVVFLKDKLKKQDAAELAKGEKEEPKRIQDEMQSPVEQKQEIEKMIKANDDFEMER